MSTEVQKSAACASATSPSILLLVLRVAFRRRRLIGVAALAFVALASVVALLLPNQYTATAVILPPQENSSPGAAMIAQLGNLGAMASLGAGALGIKNPNDLQVALLKSRSVEDAMVARFHLQALYRRKYLSTARKRWERATSIDNGLKDGLIRVSVTDRDPRRAATLANGWVEEYRRFSATLAITEASQRSVFFERELNGAREALTRAEDDMKQTEQRTGMLAMDGQASAMIASAAHASRPGGGQGGRDSRDARVCRRPESRSGSRGAGVDRHGRTAGRNGRGQRSPSGDLVAPKGKVTQAAWTIRAPCAR